MEAYTGPIDDQLTRAQAEKLIRALVPKARRRSVAEAELSEIVDHVLAGAGQGELVDALRAELKAVLMSPAFIYRGLLMHCRPGQHPVDDFELAERLSYFLWGDMPDDTLFRLAAEGSLQNSQVLHQQVDRMLLSGKARNLAEDFAFQWLAIGEIEHTSDNYPLRQSLTAQAVEFMHYLFSEDRPLMELIDSDVTFINPLIAKFYQADRKQMRSYQKPKGIEVEFVAHQKINLEHTVGRGGILTMPGIVAMNRGPVLRGVWMLERILGDPLPDPPMDVGTVPANRKGENLTFRERFQMHRSNPTCAVCHDKIDPLGFALQHYNGAGELVLGGGEAAAGKSRSRKQNQYATDTTIDTSGQLPSGERFDDIDGLKRILASSQRQAIIRNIVERTMSYALCRKLEIHDKLVVDRMVADLDHSNGTYRDLFHQVVNSLPFRETVIPEQSDASQVSPYLPSP